MTPGIALGLFGAWLFGVVCGFWMLAYLLRWGGPA